MLAEDMIYTAILGLFGNQLVLGVFLFVALLAMMVFLRINETAMLVIFEPVLFLMFCFIPELKIIAAIAMGLLFGVAILKMTRG